MNEGDILLIEDDPDDVDLTLRAFRRNSLKNGIIVARDDAEAQAFRADERTVLLPVVILTSSVEEEDLVAAYRGGVNSYIRKPVDSTSFLEVVRELGLHWLVLNEPAPGA
ncbi:MAG: response regulator [Actinomycetota bacterium]